MMYNGKQQHQRSNGLFCSISRTAFVVALSLPTLIHGKTPLSSVPKIPTHHGIDADLYLKKRGGAVVTKRRHLKKYPTPPSSSGRKSESVGTDASVTASYQENTSYFTKSIEDLTNYMQLEKKADIAATAAASISPKQNDGLSTAAIVYMSLLALQFGIQPILVRKFTPQTIVRSSVVLVQEVVKFGIAGAIYFSGTGKSSREKDFEGWSIKNWIALAGLPALLYTIQNIATLMAQQNIEALTFNVLNQTKILSAALSCYFILGKQQSRMQVVSLCLLIFSTLVIERIVDPASLFLFSGGESAFGLGNALKGVSGAFASLRSITDGAGRRVTHGVVPLLLASMISGTAGALTQLSTQGGARKVWGKSKPAQQVSRPPRNAYLFSMEMSIASIALLLFSLGCSSSGRSILQSRSFFDNWTPHTFIPVITNSIGGILVGLVTKHAGSVRKGFALIFGLLLSGLCQANGTGVRTEQIIGGLLAAASLWMHTVHPYKAPPSNKSD
jgi:UDP-sugar transporter A1/2/3